MIYSFRLLPVQPEAGQKIEGSEALSNTMNLQKDASQKTFDIQC